VIAVALYRIVPDRSRVWIDARSSLHPIHSTTDGLEGYIDLDARDGEQVDRGVQPLGKLSFPVARLSSGNPLEDRELYRRIDARRFPTIDGVLIDTKTDTAINYNGAQFLRLGRWGGGGRNWNGLMDEVGIYDRALSAAEIQDILNARADADLEVTISDSPDPVLLGDGVTYTVNVTNHGPISATGVVVVAQLPAGEVFNSVTIPVGALASGASTQPPPSAAATPSRNRAA